MNTIHLTDAELEMTRHALHSYLQDFSHDQADMVKQIKQLIAKFDQPQPGDEPRYIA